jgi:ribonucleotide reductase, class II
MVRELSRVHQGSGSSEEISPQTQQFESAHCETLDFPASAPTANPVFFRTYSRFTATGRETWQDVCTRTLAGLVKLGKLTDEEADVIDRMQRQVKAMPSGRWLWVGGSEWLEQPQNFSGAYNCTSTNVCDWAAFALMMDLAMMGCGTGGILEPNLIGNLPAIRNQLSVTTISEIGKVSIANRQELSTVEIAGNNATIRVGDSRQGWVNSYKILLELSTDDRFDGEVQVSIDLSNVRPAGEPLKGFGGVANPVRLLELYGRCAGILNKAIGRQLNSVECCLLIDEAAVTIVAGNIRRCLPAGALVHSESGLVPIEKIRIGDRVLTSKGFYPVTNFFDQGEQSLCRIKTQDSYFECTADHKVAVLTDIYGNYEMVKTKDLQPNDRLVFVPQAIPGTATELPEFKGELAPQSKRITIPALTPEVAYFFGYLHGDGSVASDGWRVRFRVAEHQQQILKKLISVGELFGLDTHTLRTPEQCQAKAFELQFNSNALNQYLSQFKQPFTSLSVPDCILLGTKDIREAYLAGLADADGCYSQAVLVASVHSDFLRQIQTMYASLGITTRLCSSIRKRNGTWEGELVTVGARAFDDTASIFKQHSVIFADNHKERPKSFKDHGFPKEMVRPLVNTYQYGWSNHQEQMIVTTLNKFIPEATNLIPVKVESVEMDVRTSHTYDIEVASIHEFVCEGILVSNSAGMRQFNSDDTLGATAKDNLWQQDENGNWRIDPERDALRMSNHTRVFHKKPTLEECVAAVQKQYYSGEGAIQWAGEAVARSNADLLDTPAKKQQFIDLYGQSQELAKGYLRELLVSTKNSELKK